MSLTAMTQAEMVTEVANIIGRDKTSLSADQVTTYEDRIKTWLYWSHLTIARIYAFPELDQDPVDKTLTANVYAYTLTTLGLTSARVRQILGVTLIDGTSSHKLVQKLWRTFEKDHPSVTDDSANSPMHYTIYGKRIELWPKPSEAYVARIRVNYYPANFASSSDVSIYENKDDVIIAGAVTHAYVSLQEIEDAKYWANIFAGRLQSSIGPVQDPQDWEPEGRAFDYNTGMATGSFEANPLVFFNS